MTAGGAAVDADLRHALRSTVVIGFERSHEGDPRLGFELLAEVACRALSPGINDPQSAVACVEYLGSLLGTAGARGPADYPPAVTPDGRVRFQRPGFAAMLARAFRPVMRDGAASAEVVFAILRILTELAEKAHPDYLEAIESEALRLQTLGESSLQYASDREALRRKTARLQDRAAGRRG
jgi:uncharacterized membrane protein